MSYSSYSSDQSYVSQQPGWRLVFVSLLIAAILGMSFRLYFSPKRIKGWIEAELIKQPAKIELKFDKAELRLARGVLPQLAIHLTNVEGRSARSCAKDPGFKISEIFIPFRVSELVQGRVAVGTVHGERLAVDLDALRDRCETEAASGSNGDGSDSSSGETAVAKPVAAPKPAIAKGPVRPWWTPEQLQTVKNLVGGLSFEEVALSFEKRAKTVTFEDLSVRADVAPEAIWLATDVRVPKELLFSQTLPPFALEATVRPEAADIEIRGNLSEGSLNGLATLRAASSDVSIDAHLNVISVPLAALLPLAKHAGWSGEMQPRFVWLNCEASVRGEIRRLFKDNPVTIEKCAIEGDNGRIAIDKAVLGPGSALQPFEATVAGLDIQKILDMFKAKGPSGVMSRYGRLAGRVSVRSRDDIEFDGALVDTQFRFSSRNVRTVQSVAEIRAKASYKNERVNLAIDNVDLTGGRFQGRLVLDMDADMKQGRIDASISELGFHPEVQALLVGGAISGVTIEGKGEIEEGKLAGFKGDIGVASIEGEHVRIRKGHAKVSIEKGGARLETSVPEGEIAQTSRLFAALQPVFLGHKFETEWVPFKDAIARLGLENRVLSWEKASVLLRNGQIWLTGAGSRDDGGLLRGWVSVDYPKLKKLRWDVGGSSAQPSLDPLPKTLADIKRQPIDNAVLGVFIPATKSTPGSEDGAGLRSLGQKVLDRAKAILPKLEDGGVQPVNLPEVAMPKANDATRKQ